MKLLHIIGLVNLLHIWSAKCQQSCTCDLTTGVCEVNCCCDADCQMTDVTTFSKCVEYSFSNVTQLCVQDQVVWINNPHVVAEVRENDQFCIVEDSFSQQNFYINPPCVAPSTCFNNVEPVNQIIPPLSDITLGLTYLAGDVIVVEYTSGARSYLSIPAASFSGSCKNYNPVQFLFPRTDSCNRHITDLATECAANSSLDFASYSNFEVLLPLNNTVMNNTNATVTVNTVCMMINGTTRLCDSPQYTAPNCSNAVLSVSYTITTADVNGTSSVDAVFILDDIELTDFPLTQTFSVSFQTSTNAAANTVPVVRSGNPGYLVGRPLVTASVQDSTATPNNNIFLITPDASGMCSSTTDTRLPILFGQSQRTGCLEPMPSSLDCAALQTTIRAVLDDVLFDASSSPFYVGVYGNVDSADFNPAVWLEVTQGVYNASPSNTSRGCTGMVLNARYEISYANTGFVTIPQPQIIAIRHSYGEPEFLPFLCPPSTTCNQQIEVSTTVNFIDVSETILSQQRSTPTIEEKYPINFFFPLKNIAFDYSSAPRVTINFFLMFFCLILLLYDVI